MQIKQQTGIGLVGGSNNGFACWFKLANRKTIRYRDNLDHFYGEIRIYMDPDHLIIVCWKKWGKDVSIAVSIMSLFASLLIQRSSRDILKGAFIKQLHLTLYFHKSVIIHETYINSWSKYHSFKINDIKPKVKLKKLIIYPTNSHFHKPRHFLAAWFQTCK